MSDRFAVCAKRKDTMARYPTGLLEEKVKKKVMAVLGCLLIIVCGLMLAALLTNVPVGYSDAEAATIGRKYYYGLPLPHYTAPGETIMGAWGRAMILFPFNAMFWTVAVAFLSCIPSRKIRWRRIVGVLLTEAALFALICFGPMPF